MLYAYQYILWLYENYVVQYCYAIIDAFNQVALCKLTLNLYSQTIEMRSNCVLYILYCGITFIAPNIILLNYIFKWIKYLSQIPLFQTRIEYLKLWANIFVHSVESVR